MQPIYANKNKVSLLSFLVLRLMFWLLKNNLSINMNFDKIIVKLYQTGLVVRVDVWITTKRS